MKEQKLFRRYGVSLALAVVGGFLEAYTYVTRDGVFANAQTGNIARMGLNLAQGNVLLTLRYLIPVIAFMAGVTLSLQLRRFRQDWERIILILEIALLFLVGLIPAHKLSILATVTVSFVCALQVESFRKFGEHAFASTMCTGNLRSGTDLLMRYQKERNRQDLIDGFKYYMVNVIFIAGALISVFVTNHFGGTAVIFCTIPLIIVFVLMFFSPRKKF